MSSWEWSLTSLVICWMTDEVMFWKSVMFWTGKLFSVKKLEPNFIQVQIKSLIHLFANYFLEHSRLHGLFVNVTGFSHNWCTIWIIQRDRLSRPKDLRKKDLC